MSWGCNWGPAGLHLHLHFTRAPATVLSIVNELDHNATVAEDGTPIAPDEMVPAQGRLLKALEQHKDDALACAVLVGGRTVVLS